MKAFINYKNYKLDEVMFMKKAQAEVMLLKVSMAVLAGMITAVIFKLI